MSARRSRRRSFVVQLEMPIDASMSDVKSYIFEAVTTWRGQCRPSGSYSDDDPGDPMFGLNAETVIVKTFLEKVTGK